MFFAAEAPRTVRLETRDASRLVGPAYLLLSLIALAALTIGQVPLAVDLSNHATRLFIECNVTDPVLSRMYEVRYDLIPNLAIDLLHRPVCGLVDPMTIVRGSMIAAMAGVLLMSWKLHCLLNGRPHAISLLAPAMTFNIITGMGYVNYLIGTFLLLLFAWTMLRFRLIEGHTAVAVLVPNLFGGLIFLCHIFALALAGMFLLGLRFASEARQPFVKRVLKAGVVTAGSFVVPMLMMLLAERSGAGFEYMLAGKVRAFWGPLIYWSLYPTAALVFAWIGLLWWMFRERFVILDPAVRWSLAFMSIFALALPSVLLSATDLDSRCLTSVAFLAVAAIVPRGERGRVPNRVQFAAAVLAAGTILVQIVSFVPKSALLERQVAELRSAAQVIQPLKSVLMLQDDLQQPPMHEQLYFHLASYLARDESAFNTLEFTGVGMQPLRVKPEFACLDTPADRPIFLSMAQQLLDPSDHQFLQGGLNESKAYASEWPKRFDYVILYQWGPKSNPFPTLLTPVRRGSFFTIFRTPRRAAAQGPCSTAVG